MKRERGGWGGKNWAPRDGREVFSSGELERETGFILDVSLAVLHFLTAGKLACNRFGLVL